MEIAVGCFSFLSAPRAGPAFEGSENWGAMRSRPMRSRSGSRGAKWEPGPTIVAVLEGGPLAGRRLEAAVVEGRPPKTLDAQADDGSTYRYCLAEWSQAGPSAVYTFLYPV